MVGRAEELDRLLTHVERAITGRTSAVLLAGDAGVGKTRLLDELTARAGGRGVRVLTGHCVDLGAREPRRMELPCGSELRSSCSRSVRSSPSP